jgi:hypothetical protein
MPIALLIISAASSPSTTTVPRHEYAALSGSSIVLQAIGEL